MPLVVTLTVNPSVDKSSRVDHVVPEDKLRCDPPTFQPGGGGLNVSRAMSHLGVSTTALWTRGGPDGDLLCGLLDDEQITHQPIPIRGWTRQNLTIHEGASDRQYRFGMPGPRLSDREVERCLEAALAARCDYLVLSGSLPPGAPADLYARIAEGTREGTRVVLDTSGEALAQAVARGVFLLKPNLRELEALAAGPLEDDRSIRAAAERLISDGRAEVVVVSIGAGGVIVATDHGTSHIRAPTVPIRSKVGAGDSTVAGIVTGLVRGMPLSNAIRYGVAAGSAAVLTPGTDLCHLDDTERLFEQLISAPAG